MSTARACSWSRLELKHPPAKKVDDLGEECGFRVAGTAKVSHPAGGGEFAGNASWLINIA